jgi:hypothetical protein
VILQQADSVRSVPNCSASASTSSSLASPLPSPPLASLSLSLISTKSSSFVSSSSELGSDPSSESIQGDVDRRGAVVVVLHHHYHRRGRGSAPPRYRHPGAQVETLAALAAPPASAPIAFRLPLSPFRFAWKWQGPRVRWIFLPCFQTARKRLDWQGSLRQNRAVFMKTVSWVGRLLPV